MIWFDTMATPVGELTLVADEQGLQQVMFEQPGKAPGPRERWQHAPERLTAARTQLQEYFAGARREFDLPLHAVGTAFQQRVWAALRQIPFGQTASYGDVARAIDAPTAVRAVGAANGRNPLPIIVPCHRVIGADGRLVGFSAGLERKRWLLTHEGALCIDQDTRARVAQSRSLVAQAATIASTDGTST